MNQNNKNNNPKHYTLIIILIVVLFFYVFYDAIYVKPKTNHRIEEIRLEHKKIEKIAKDRFNKEDSILVDLKKELVEIKMCGVLKKTLASNKHQ